MKYEEIEKYKLELKELSLESNKKFKKIKCASCQEEIPADNININDKIAKCNNCNAVFAFHSAINQLIADTGQIKQEILRPEGIDIFHYKEDLDISIKQPFTVLEGIVIPLVFFFTFLFTMIFLKEAKAIWFFVGSWIANIVVLANLFTRSKHKIHINITDRDFLIEWRPNKLIRSKSFDVQDISQLYINKYNGYALNIIVDTPNGQKHHRLLTGISSLSKAQYLEQEIERHLGIKDRSIPEETAKK